MWEIGYWFIFFERESEFDWMGDEVGEEREDGRDYWFFFWWESEVWGGEEVLWVDREVFGLKWSWEINNGRFVVEFRVYVLGLNERWERSNGGWWFRG